MILSDSIPSIHCSMGSAPIGVQCPLTSSLGEFPGYWDWLWYPGLSPVLVSNALLIWVFSHSLFFTCHWISFVYFSQWRYLHLATNPPPVTGLGTSAGPQWIPRRSRPIVAYTISLLFLPGFYCFIICLLRHCSFVVFDCSMFCLLRNYTISSRLSLFRNMFVTPLLCSRLQLSFLLFVTSLYYCFKVSIVPYFLF